MKSCLNMGKMKKKEEKWLIYISERLSEEKGKRMNEKERKNVFILN